MATTHPFSDEVEISWIPHSLSGERTMSNHLALPPELQHIRSAYRRHDYHAVSNESLIRAAQLFDAMFSRERPGPVRSQIAAILIALYYELNRRMNRAPFSADALPAANGVQWNSRSNLAGLLEDIPPFGALDFWVMALEPTHPARHRVRSSGSRTQEITMPGETVRPSRPPEIRDRNDLDGMTPTPNIPGEIGDIFGALDTANNIMGVISMAIESFAMDLAGIAAGVLISVGGLFATWVDYDRRVGRLHASYQICQTLYDMSFPFADETLMRRPYANWPALREPISPDLPQGSSHDVEVIRNARQQAHRQARDMVFGLEQHPRHRVVRWHDRDFRIPITGKVYLYLLNIAARRHHQSVLLYLRYAMQRQTGLDLSMFRWTGE
jgi:hypothetical protein